MPSPVLAEPAHTEYRIGVEGFQDKYTEDSVDLVEHARFGSVSADYIHSANGFFTSVQSRVSYGRDDYKSISGVARNIPQYEGELRGITGVTVPIPEMGGVRAIVPYVGLGIRHFYDNSKGLRTSSGFNLYDRRITQFYIPIGANWSFTKGDFVFSPNLELDLLFYGKVNSRFRNFDPTAKNLDNTQRRGVGFRGEFMVGQKYEDYSWQIGPFFRYWKVDDSDSDTIPSGFNAGTYIEPENARLQTGGALRVQF
ncbi:MAG: hypothetical protein K2Q01_09040 [Rickettsiales bacterium]|nr:hypothetical protein [Rickettsiales bacterium]